MGMDVVKAGKDLEKDALHALLVQILVITGLHKLIKISIHVLHDNVQFPAERIQEDVQSRNQMGVGGERSQKDDFTEVEA